MQYENRIGENSLEGHWSVNMAEFQYVVKKDESLRRGLHKILAYDLVIESGEPGIVFVVIATELYPVYAMQRYVEYKSTDISTAIEVYNDVDVSSCDPELAMKNALKSFKGNYLLIDKHEAFRYGV